METDRNLLFGVLALQAELIDPQQFIEGCTVWAARKNLPLAEVLVERGWISADDQVHIDYLLERKLRKNGGNVRASLAMMPADVRCALAALGDESIHHSMVDLAAKSVPSAMPTIDQAPQSFQRYQRSRLHAQGGLGQVWLARDRALDRDVALKELRPERSQNALHQARFLREARITGQLEHPGIVPVYELDNGLEHPPFYTMRFVKGQTLSEAIHAYHARRATAHAEPLELLNLLNALVTVSNTIAYAHSRGIIHRDLKGQNVVVGDFGEVVLLDWGLAKAVHQTQRIALIDEAQPTEHAPSNREMLEHPISLNPIDSAAEFEATLAGSVLGTPAYMAPEQAAGRLDLLDERTDVYGLGAILYEILTGTPPFFGADTREVLRKVRDEEPNAPKQFWAEVPSILEQTCLKALAKRREDRFPTAKEFGHQIQKWLAESAERQQAEQHQARFFALSVDLMCMASFDGYFKQLNPAWEKTLGWTLDELKSRPWIEFLHPDDVAPTIAVAQRIMAGEILLCLENRYRCKDGSYRWMQWASQEVVGQQLMYAVARDVTERKEAEAHLRTSEERYRSVIAAMPDGIVLLDADGSIWSCNASAERILGLTADQMTGRTPRDPRWGAVQADGSPYPGEMHPPMVTLRTGKPCSNIVMGIHKPDGQLTWLSVNTQPLFGLDGVTLAGVVACFADITERRHLEEKLQQAERELESARIIH